MICGWYRYEIDKWVGYKNDKIIRLFEGESYMYMSGDLLKDFYLGSFFAWNW